MERARRADLRPSGTECGSRRPSPQQRPLRAGARLRALCALSRPALAAARPATSVLTAARGSLLSPRILSASQASRSRPRRWIPHFSLRGMGWKPATFASCGPTWCGGCEIPDTGVAAAIGALYLVTVRGVATPPQRACAAIAAAAAIAATSPVAACRKEIDQGFGEALAADMYIFEQLYLAIGLAYLRAREHATRMPQKPTPDTGWNIEPLICRIKHGHSLKTS